MIRIDQEFHELIFPLSDAEYSELTASIQREGCRDPIITWNDIILDGHNRYEICNKLNIEYQVKPIQMADRDSAKEWILTNQLARRNLGKYQLTKLALKRDSIVKAKCKEKQILAGKKELLLLEGEASGGRDNETDFQIAKAAGVSHNYVHQVRKIEASASQETKQLISQGKTTVKAEYNKLRSQNKEPKRTEGETAEQIKRWSAEGLNSEQIAGKIHLKRGYIKTIACKYKIALADQYMGKNQILNVNKVIGETINLLQNLTMGLKFTEGKLASVNKASIPEWLEMLTESLSIFTKLKNKLMKMGGKNE